MKKRLSAFKSFQAGEFNPLFATMISIGTAFHKKKVLKFY